MKPLAFASVVLAFFCSDAAFAYFWADGNRRPCDEVCPAPRSRAVVSGTYRSTDARLNGQQFFACRANAAREGLRAGYNLKPNWSKHCWVGYGGQERPEPNYQCLCSEVELSWVDLGASFQSCDEACRPSRPVISGTYVSSDPSLHRQPFFVCSGDFGDGRRVGYNLKGFGGNHCYTGHGGREQYVPWPYKCLCE
jgi:hypothetical protein